MISVADARQFVLSACGALAPTRVAIGAGSGHVLAETVRATEAVPPFANSAMDGYALTGRRYGRCTGAPSCGGVRHGGG